MDANALLVNLEAMGAAEKIDKFSIEEYLKQEALSDVKSDFVNGRILERAVCNPRHNTIVMNLFGHASPALLKRGCQPFGSDQRIFIDKHLNTNALLYPDYVVVCGKLQLAVPDRNAITNPNAIVEVVSENTEGFDFGTKATIYWNIATLSEYVLVAQVEPKVYKYTRRDSHHWDLEIIEGMEGGFTLLDVEVSMAELYQFVEFGPEDPE